jgi:hypothetical protein
MADPFTGASWSMGYGIDTAPPAPIRRPDGTEIEQPGNGRTWWDEQLAPASDLGLDASRWHASDTAETRFWGASGLHEERVVSLRLPRYLERRGGDDITEEIMVNVEARATRRELGRWVIEDPAKWFRGRRAWALNRPPFHTGELGFDEHAVSWAWDCSEGVSALRDALVPILPSIRDILDTQPGAIVTDNGVSTWIPFDDIDSRLPALLSSASTLARK